MTSHFSKKRPKLTDEALEKLAYLASVVEVAGPDKPLVIRHGKCQLRLDVDGTVSISGKRILQDADTNISLRAGWIDLN